MTKSAKKEEQGKNILEALQLRRKLLQEHYKHALVTNTTSYQSSCENSSDEYDSENEQQQLSLKKKQHRQADQHGDKKKRDLGYYHPEEQHDTRKWKKRKGLVEKNKLKTTTTKIIADESSLEDESFKKELVEKNSDSIKTTENGKEENQIIEDVKTRILKNGVEEKIWTRSEFRKLSFEERLNELAKYKEVHGNCNVSRHDTKNASLAWWVYRLRVTRRGRKNRYKDLKLTPANIAKLDELGFQWINRTKTFEKHLHDLKEYKAKHGNCNVPYKYKDNPTLGVWCKSMRASYQAFKQGKNPQRQINQEMIDKLESIGFSWKFKKTFEEHLLELKEYKAKHDDCKVPYNYKDNKQLGSWVINTRAAYKAIQAGKKPYHRLTPSMINQLNDMGFNWQGKK